MPDARTHDLITVVTAAGAAPFLIALPQMTAGQVGVLAASYLLSGLLFSPDLDLHSRPYLRWGRLRGIWWPYQKVVRHRSVISHGLVLGPLLRIVYFAVALYLILLLGLLLLNLLTPIDPTGTSWQIVRYVGGYIERHPTVAWLALIGFILGGAAHSIADVISTFFKRHMRLRF